MAINFWTQHKGKRLAIREINGQLEKFVGRKANPIDELFVAMRKVVHKHFKKHPEQLKYFSENEEPFDYTFEVEEQAGFVTDVNFVIE